MKSPLCYFHYHGRVAPIPKDKFPNIPNTMHNYTYVCHFMFKDTEKKEQYSIIKQLQKLKGYRSSTKSSSSQVLL